MTRRTKEAIQSSIAQLEDKLNRERAALEQVSSPEFPLEATIYLHSSEDNMWDQGAEFNLDDDQMSYFKYVASEVEIKIVIDKTGQAKATHLNRIALKEPVAI